LPPSLFFPLRHHSFIFAEDEPKTEELRHDQAERAGAERERAETSERPAEEKQHRRRADKAGYLAEKLEEQREADG